MTKLDIETEKKHILELLSNSNIKQAKSIEFQNDLVGNILPQFNLFTEVTVERKIALGASKFGGRPDLPLNFRWPTNIFDNFPLSFFAQINLSELPENYFSTNNGILYFFVDNRQISFNYQNYHLNKCKVIYSSKNAILKRRVLPARLAYCYNEILANENDSLISDESRSISFEETISIPLVGSLFYAKWNLDNLSWNEFCSEAKDYYETSQISMLGDYWTYQPLAIDTQKPSEYLNLLQLTNYTFENWDFIDTGLPETIRDETMASRNFLIRKQDFEDLKFDNVLIQDDWD